jgi:hypothetical protein
MLGFSAVRDALSTPYIKSRVITREPHAALCKPDRARGAVADSVEHFDDVCVLRPPQASQLEAWYIAALVSWSIALFEYLMQVPANRIGYEAMNLPQLKILQEVITLPVLFLSPCSTWARPSG